MDNRKLKQIQLEVLMNKMVRASIQKIATQKEIAQMYGFTEATVSRRVTAFRASGEVALKYKKRGRPAHTIQKLTDEQQNTICNMVEKSTPEAHGLNCVLWTRKAVRELIERKFKVRYALRTMSDILKKWQFTPQKPTKIAIQQDISKVKQWLEIDYPSIKVKARKENASIYWCDEMGLRSNDQRGRTYGKKGKTPSIKKTGARFSCNMIATITNYGLMKWMVFEKNFTISIFINFLRRLIYKAPKKIFLIVDNHSVHHAKKVRSWIEKHNKKIELFYLPPYSPELNPQELVNQEVKGHATNFKIISKLEDLTTSLRVYLTDIQFNAFKIMKYFKKDTVKYAA